MYFSDNINTLPVKNELLYLMPGAVIRASVVRIYTSRRLIKWTFFCFSFSSLVVVRQFTWSSWVRAASEQWPPCYNDIDFIRLKANLSNTGQSPRDMTSVEEFSR